jgi:hypothetical protein
MNYEQPVDYFVPSLVTRYPLLKFFKKYVDQFLDRFQKKS